MSLSAIANVNVVDFLLLKQQIFPSNEEAMWDDLSFREYGKCIVLKKGTNVLPWNTWKNLHLEMVLHTAERRCVCLMILSLSPWEFTEKSCIGLLSTQTYMTDCCLAEGQWFPINEQMYYETYLSCLFKQNSHIKITRRPYPSTSQCHCFTYLMPFVYIQIIECIANISGDSFSTISCQSNAYAAL